MRRLACSEISILKREGACSYILCSVEGVWRVDISGLAWSPERYRRVPHDECRHDRHASAMLPPSPQRPGEGPAMCSSAVQHHPSAAEAAVPQR